MLRTLPSRLTSKIKPTQGFSHVIHIGVKALLPILAYVLVRIDFVGLAILLILIAKWRIFAVQPRYWIANIIASGIDLIVGVALVLFMANTSVEWWQLFWTAAYAGWLIWLKPRSDVLSVSAQAMIGQLLGLAALYLKFGDASLVVLILGTWAVAYIAARHYMTSFEEPLTALMSHVWAYFAAGLAFVLGHWLLFYGSVAQIIVILTTVGYGLAAIYYLDASERLSRPLTRQLLLFMCGILLIVFLLSDWTGATV